jgi:thiol-disulfide isomerase/thioredoxin
MWSFKGFIAVLVTAGILSVPLYYYWGFLTKGMRPPEATLKLNDMEKTGVPDFEVTALSGEKVKLSDFRGKLVLVNIWATWCAPCVKEFPSLKRMVEAMKGEVVVLAVSYDRDREDIDTFIKAFGGVPADFRIAWDKDKVTSPLLGTDVLPESYIVGRDGKLIRKIVGEANWDEPMALDFFKKLASN